MTLGRELILSGLIVLLGLFCGMSLFMVQNTQQFLNHQLSAHAQDTATVLGLSLSHTVKNNDVIMTGRMVDSIWDAGYYQKIEVNNLEGVPIVTKEMDIHVADVPNWFIQVLDLKTEKKSALIQSGWMQMGRVFVESNPGFAYRQIWETFTDSLLWLLLITLIALSLGMLLLHIILKPLREITRQAEAICHQNFVVQKKLPRTIDLRLVVEAMNRMSSRLKNIFEEQSRTSEDLQKQAFQSAVTGLSNRRFFDMQLQHFFHDKSGGISGVLLLIELKDFKNFNEKYGYEKGDALLKSVALTLQEHASSIEQVIIAHFGGANFSILLVNKTQDFAVDLAQAIIRDFSDYPQKAIARETEIGHVGITTFAHNEDPKRILSKADMALRKAQMSGTNSYAVFEEDLDAKVQGAQAWAKMFEDIIAAENILLFFQPYKIFNKEKDLVYYEVLLRLKDENGNVIAANQFMPMAERLNKILSLDKLVLQKICQRILDENGQTTYSVNLSGSSLDDATFVKFLRNQIQRLGKLANAIVIELPEYGVVSRLETIKDIFRQLRSMKAKTAIDHYGKNFTSFGYLHSMSLTFLKIDGSYVRNINEEDNQFFIRSLINIAHSLDIMVIAEAVESDNELAILQNLKVDGVQGYLLGKPKESTVL